MPGTDLDTSRILPHLTSTVTGFLEETQLSIWHQEPLLVTTFALFGSNKQRIMMKMIMMMMVTITTY